jgi:FAD/FMN-containing dehydrogenase
MTPHAHAAHEPPPLDRRARSFVGRHWRILAVALAALSAIAVMLWPGGEAAERRALLRMAPAERRALYDEMLRSTESLCARSEAATSAALRDRCVQSTRFLRAFPECDDACQRLARAHEPGPTR